MNFYLVEQNKKTKDGRKVYLDAKNYFRGAAVRDAILTENMDELVNYKLTHVTPNGAEGYNNKFNDIVNSLEQQGHVLEPQILKSIHTWEILRTRFISMSRTLLPHQTLSPYQRSKLRSCVSICLFKVRDA